MRNYAQYICIVGAGPIGNHLAAELLERGMKVLVIEAGNLKDESTLLGFKDYEFSTPSMLPLNVHRVGGGGNYWIGRIGEFLEQDFYSLEEIRKEEWLLKKNDLLPFYRSAYSKLVGNELLDSEFIEKHLNALFEVPSGFEIRPIRYTEPLNLRNRFESFMSNPNLKLVQNALATKVYIADGSMNPIVVVKHEDGSLEEITVSQIIFACGALQSAKLFLASTDLHNSDNIDCAGHYLMEHLDGYVGTIQVRKSDKKFIKTVLLNSERKLMNSQNLNCGLALSLDGAKSGGKSYINVGFEILSEAINYRFAPVINGEGLDLRSPARKLAYLLERFFQKVFGGFYRIFKERLFGVCTYSIWLKAEELPYFHSKVSLEDVDSNVLKYHHLVSLRTSEAVRDALKRFEELMNSHNLGTVKFYNHVMDPSRLLQLRPNWHPMGTLRIGRPGEGVVDTDLKIHGVPNSYVLSSAVFPTGSNQNPVFTTLALGTRLAEHLALRTK